MILWPLTKVVTLVQQKGQIAGPTEMSLETIVENIQRQRKESELDTADFEMIMVSYLYTIRRHEKLWYHESMHL